MEIVLLEVVLSLTGCGLGAYLGLSKEKSKPSIVQKVVYSKQISNRNNRIKKTNDLDLRYINTSNIGIFIDSNTFTTFSEYYGINTNIIFDFTNNSIKEYLLSMTINESSGIYFIYGDKIVSPCNIVKRNIDKENIPSLHKINNVSELNKLLENIDRNEYARYISAYFEQIRMNYLSLEDLSFEQKNGFEITKK